MARREGVNGGRIALFASRGKGGRNRLKNRPRGDKIITECKEAGGAPFSDPPDREEKRLSPLHHNATEAGKNAASAPLRARGAVGPSEKEFSMLN